MEKSKAGQKRSRSGDAGPNEFENPLKQRRLDDLPNSPSLAAIQQSVSETLAIHQNSNRGQGMLVKPALNLLSDLLRVLDQDAVEDSLCQFIRSLTARDVARLLYRFTILGDLDKAMMPNGYSIKARYEDDTDNAEGAPLANEQSIFGFMLRVIMPHKAIVVLLAKKILTFGKTMTVLEAKRAVHAIAVVYFYAEVDIRSRVSLAVDALECFSAFIDKKYPRLPNDNSDMYFYRGDFLRLIDLMCFDVKDASTMHEVAKKLLYLRFELTGTAKYLFCQRLAEIGLSEVYPVLRAFIVMIGYRYGESYIVDGAVRMFDADSLHESISACIAQNLLSELIDLLVKCDMDEYVLLLCVPDETSRGILVAPQASELKMGLSLEGGVIDRFFQDDGDVLRTFYPFIAGHADDVAGGADDVLHYRYINFFLAFLNYNEGAVAERFCDLVTSQDEDGRYALSSLLGFLCQVDVDRKLMLNDVYRARLNGRAVAALEGVVNQGLVLLAKPLYPVDLLVQMHTESALINEEELEALLLQGIKDAFFIALTNRQRATFGSVGAYILSLIEEGFDVLTYSDRFDKKLLHMLMEVRSYEGSGLQNLISVVGRILVDTLKGKPVSLSMAVMLCYGFGKTYTFEVDPDRFSPQTEYERYLHTLLLLRNAHEVGIKSLSELMSLIKSQLDGADRLSVLYRVLVVSCLMSEHDLSELMFLECQPIDMDQALSEFFTRFSMCADDYIRDVELVERMAFLRQSMNASSPEFVAEANQHDQKALAKRKQEKSLGVKAMIGCFADDLNIQDIFKAISFMNNEQHSNVMKGLSAFVPGLMLLLFAPQQIPQPGNPAFHHDGPLVCHSYTKEVIDIVFEGEDNLVMARLAGMMQLAQSKPQYRYHFIAFLNHEHVAPSFFSCCLRSQAAPAGLAEIINVGDLSESVKQQYDNYIATLDSQSQAAITPSF